MAKKNAREPGEGLPLDTPVVVNPGQTVQLEREIHREGAVLKTSAKSAKRLIARGVVSPAKKGAAAPAAES